MKNSNLLVVATAAIISVSAYSGYHAYQLHDQEAENSLFLENIEALATIETNTSWGCDASSSSSCKAYCGTCFTEVSGTGKTTGTHSCSRN